jgi:hypothetical protein
MRSLPLWFALLCVAVRAEVAPLLREVAGKWMDERSHWAFTQLAKETDKDGKVLERLERFDPSHGYERRWELLKLNGRTPSAREIEEWRKKKNSKKKDPKPWLEYVDLEHAKVRDEDARTVSYDIPLKRSAGGLFPGDKVAVTLTINKESRDLERAQANIDGPFNIALGLARVVDLDLDLELLPEDQVPGQKARPGEQPKGTAIAVVNKLGKRVEYKWSEFKRITKG